MQEVSIRAISCIYLLLTLIADVNFISNSGITPLTLAIQNQRDDIVSRLLYKVANVSVPTIYGITPLALATHIGNISTIGLLLQAGAERDDGSLHDAARELRCDSIRLLIEYGFQVDYPSERHEGRSALAELCINAVKDHPDPAKIEVAIRCLITHGSVEQLRTHSGISPGKTPLHFALDSPDPMLLLPILLKMTWEIINKDCFLYSDELYTYSLTKYVEKGVYSGPKDQKEDILRLLRDKGQWIDTGQTLSRTNNPQIIATSRNTSKRR